MIGHISGKVLHKEERSIIVEVGGVGYILAISPRNAEHTKNGDAIILWTHLVVKEDALDLYGFPNRDELTLFRLLIGISGIGPKSALNILSLADVDTLLHAVRSKDSSYLTKVSGIGKKLAEKIILELKDKAIDIIGGAELPHAESEALDALEALGYAPRDTRELVRMLAKEHSTAQDIIRKALQTLGGR